MQGCKPRGRGGCSRDARCPESQDIRGPKGLARWLLMVGPRARRSEAEEVPPHHFSTSGELPRRTRGPVPFLRVPGRLLFGPWASSRVPRPPEAFSLLQGDFRAAMQGCNGAGGGRGGSCARCLESQDIRGREGLARRVLKTGYGARRSEAEVVPPHPFSTFR